NVLFSEMYYTALMYFLFSLIPPRGTELLHLAVLHPKKLCVYSVSGTLGNVEHGNQYQIKLMYEHNLQRTACNMTHGPFGGVKGIL
ncbi:hypothetical protein GDO78_013868, partial [Eleutherodactylus coqui]